MGESVLPEIIAGQLSHVRSLLIAEGDDRVHNGGAPRRKEGGGNSDRNEDLSCDNKGDGSTAFTP